MQEGRHRKKQQEDFFNKIYTSHFICKVCVWEVLETNINIIFWPHCYDRHVVSCSPDVGVHSIRAFRGPPRSGVAFLTTSGLYSLGVCWQLLWDPNSTELNNNSTPTRSPTGSLNRMFNRHQAEITVMQFRGHSLPLHDCNGRMGPWPCPIS